MLKILNYLNLKQSQLWIYSYDYSWDKTMIEMKRE